MGLRGKDFDKLNPFNQGIILKAKGTPVIELKLSSQYSLILYSVYNFFVEAVVNELDGEMKCIERLSLEQVASTYCEDITSK